MTLEERLRAALVSANIPLEVSDELGPNEIDTLIGIAKALGSRVTMTGGQLKVGGVSVGSGTGGTGEASPPKVETTLAALGSGDFDGQQGLVRLGTYPDVHEEEFVWNDTDGLWVGAKEYVVINTRDTWGSSRFSAPRDRRSMTVCWLRGTAFR